jgi:hypothetical protein
MTFWKLDLFPSSGAGGRRHLAQLGPLESANLNLVSETSCFLFSRIPDDGKVQKPSNSVCYTPLFEPFRIYVWNEVRRKKSGKAQNEIHGKYRE